LVSLDDIHICFRIILDDLLNHLNIPAGDLGERLHQLGARDFDIEYKDWDFVDLLNGLHVILQASGRALTASGLVAPDTATPTNSPGRGGGDV
jgi:hypothetical protein